jgi:hypothetical protein
MWDTDPFQYMIREEREGGTLRRDRRGASSSIDCTHIARWIEGRMERHGALQRADIDRSGLCGEDRCIKWQHSRARSNR